MQRSPHTATARVLSWWLGLGALAPLAAQQPGPGRALPADTWRAWLDSPGGELPFVLETAPRAGGVSVAVHNGEERIDLSATWDGAELVVDLAPFDSAIRATLDAGGRRLRGAWRKRLGADAWSEMGFHATRGAAARFGPPPAGAGATPLAERWAVQFEQDRHPSVGVFRVDARGVARGTFLTALGDYRYLAGDCLGGALRLSCFDGAHAFLFRATLQDDGSLRGDFWSSASWHETWTARPDPRASLPDAYALTEWRGARGLGDLAFPDLDGVPRRLDDPAFAGAARLLVVLGSWCPNCNDEARYLAELHERYGPRGLAILGLAFERTGDPAVDGEQVRRFAAHHGLRFPILIAGLADKDKASQALPLLDRVRAYPTTVFLRGDGTVALVHTGFSGPATGAAHVELRDRFERTIEAMLGAGN